MLKDINSVRLSGTVFWSKLDDRGTFSMLRVGVNLDDKNGGVFITIQNPKTKEYELIKPGNKILLTSAWLDTWEKDNGINDIQIKCYDSGSEFYPREKALYKTNEVTILGKIIDYNDEYATIEMVGERNPKTNKWTVRKVDVKIGDQYNDIIGKKIILCGYVTTEEIEEKKSKTIIVANYDKINIL